jgi:hypothetical protein
MKTKLIAAALVVIALTFTVGCETQADRDALRDAQIAQCDAGRQVLGSSDKVVADCYAKIAKDAK